MCIWSTIIGYTHTLHSPTHTHIRKTNQWITQNNKNSIISTFLTNALNLLLCLQLDGKMSRVHSLWSIISWMCWRQEERASLTSSGTYFTSVTLWFLEDQTNKCATCSLVSFTGADGWMRRMIPQSHAGGGKLSKIDCVGDILFFFWCHF